MLNREYAYFNDDGKFYSNEFQLQFVFSTKLYLILRQVKLLLEKLLNIYGEINFKFSHFYFLTALFYFL